MKKMARDWYTGAEVLDIITDDEHCEPWSDDDLGFDDVKSDEEDNKCVTN